LSRLEYLSCEGNLLKELDLTSLKTVKYLLCGRNELKSLDVAGLKNLRYLTCDSNFLSRLDVAPLTNLGVLACNGNLLTSLDVASLTRLTYLNCSQNRLELLEVSRLKDLEELYCRKNNLLSLDVTSLDKLRQLNCGDNRLANLKVGELEELTQLHCQGNKLTSLNLKGLPKLTSLDCSRNDLTALDATELTALTELRCSSNNLAVLNVSGLQNLEKINCSGNKPLKELDVGGLARLQDLQCADNGLTKLNLRRARSLSTVWCIRNKLLELDAGNLPELTKLQCGNNELMKLNVTGSIKLKELTCSSNKLTELDVSDLSELTLLECSGNRLENLNVAGAIKLRRLGCSGNELPVLAVDALPELTELDCGKNRLTALSVKGLMKLARLDCSSNALTSLDLSALKRLRQAICENNPLTSLVIDEDLKARPVFLSMKKGESLQLISSMQWRVTGPLYAEPVPGGVLITAWRGMMEREMPPRAVSMSDRNFLFIKTHSDGTDILALGGYIPHLKEGRAPYKRGEALALEMETSVPPNQEALKESDFKLESGASVRFGSMGFDSAGTTPVSLKVGYQTIYAIVSNEDAKCRYQIEVFRKEETAHSPKSRREGRSSGESASRTSERLSSSPEEGQAEKGRALARAGKDREAMELLKKAVAAGDGDSAFETGVLYQNGGKNTPRDPQKATEWFTKAMEMGSVRGSMAMAFLYIEGYGPLLKNEEKAYELAWNAERSQDIFVMNQLLLFYSTYWRSLDDIRKAQKIALGLPDPAEKRRWLNFFRGLERSFSRMTMERLLLDTQENRARFDGRYGGRSITVTGNRGKIERRDEEYILTLHAQGETSSNFAPYVECRFEKRQEGILLKLHPNERVEIRGYYKDPQQTGGGVLALAACDVLKSDATSHEQRASLILNELNNLHAAALMLLADRQPSNAGEMAELEAELTTPGSVGVFLAPYVDASGRYNNPKYIFMVNKSREGNKWFIGRDLSMEAEAVRQFLKEKARSSKRIYDENLKPYNGGHVIYEEITH
jgi:hypothetical protein